MMTKKEKGDEQRRVVHDALFSIGLSIRKADDDEIYKECRKDPKFAQAFYCDFPEPKFTNQQNARIRTILQRSCGDCSQYWKRKCKWPDLYTYDRGTGLWGLRTSPTSITSTTALMDGAVDAYLLWEDGKPEPTVTL